MVNLALLEDVMLTRKPDVIREAVRCCYQEEPIQFMHWTLYDQGAFPEEPLCFKITWWIEKPWAVHSEEEQEILRRTLDAAKLRRDEERAKQRRKEDEELLRLLGVKRDKEGR
ncbi:MAG: hypothetical protein ACUVTD_03580 [Nitrososphaerales archaeon]